MRATVPLGRVGGIPVGAHWSALVVVVLLGQLLALNVLPAIAPGRSGAAYAVAGTAGAVLFVLSLLAHELAHAVVARRAGLEVRRITLWLLGGVSELAGRPERPGTEIRVAVVGPLVSIGLAGAFATAAWAVAAPGGSQLIVALFAWLAAVNGMLGIFNLLPGTPLDGGRVLHGILWRHTGSRERATRTAAGAGRFLGALVAGLGALLLLGGRLDGLWLVLVGWFLAGAAAGERVHGVLAERLTGLTAADLVRHQPFPAPGWWTVRALVDHLLASTASPVAAALAVTDLDGRPIGSLTLAALAAVPPGDRAATAVRDIARPLPPDGVVEAGSEARDVLGRPIGPAGLVVVRADGRLLGVVTAEDLQLAVELQALRGSAGVQAEDR